MTDPMMPDDMPQFLTVDILTTTTELPFTDDYSVNQKGVPFPIEKLFICIYHILMIFMFIMNSIALYLSYSVVAHRSPKSMADYKCCLLNIIFISYGIDVYISLFFQPFFIPPVYGVCIHGLLSQLSNFDINPHSIPWAFYQILLGAHGISLMNAAIYRTASLYPKGIARISTVGVKIFIFLIHFTYGMPFAWWTIVGEPEESEAMDEDLKTVHPKVYEFMDKNCKVLGADSLDSVIFGISGLLWLMSATAITSALIWWTRVKLSQQKDLLKPKVYKMHYSLLRTLWSQLIAQQISSLIPMLILFVVLLVNVGFTHHLSLIATAAVALTNFRTLFNLLVLTCCCPPYGRALRRMLPVQSTSEDDVVDEGPPPPPIAIIEAPRSPNSFPSIPQTVLSSNPPTIDVSFHSDNRHSPYIWRHSQHPNENIETTEFILNTNRSSSIRTHSALSVFELQTVDKTPNPDP